MHLVLCPLFLLRHLCLPVLHRRCLGDSDAGQWMQTNFSDIFGLWYNLLFAVLIIVFTYFYTAITVPTNKMSDDLKRSGGFVPGIRPGNETSEYLDTVMSHITFPDHFFSRDCNISCTRGKTYWISTRMGSVLRRNLFLIMVGVAIDTIQQVNSYLLNRHYDGLMKTGKTRRSNKLNIWLNKQQ